MQQKSSITQSSQDSSDPFFPSGRFAKVPAELFSILSWSGKHKLEHTEFRVFIALCKFRGPSRLVNPSQETIAMMTGVQRQNVSRAIRNLEAKGWLVAHHEDGHPKKRVVQYELMVPAPTSNTAPT